MSVGLRDAIGSVALMMARELDWDRAVEAALQAARAAFSADAVILWTAHAEARVLRLNGHSGFSEEEVSSFRVVSFDSGLPVGKAVREKTIQVVERLDDLSHDSPGYCQWTRLGFHSLVSVPLMARGSLVGAMKYLTRSSRHYSADEIQAVCTIADILGLGLENARQHTEHRRAQEALRSSEQHYRLLFETMLQGVVFQDADGKITSMNPAAERILGKSPADFLGETSVSVEHDTIREDGTPFPGLEHPSMVALRTGREVPEVVMGVFNPRERRHRWISISAVPIFRDGQQQPYQVYTLFADITERKQAEAERERLAEQARRWAAELDAVIEGVGEGICVADGEGRIVRINGRGRQIWGLPPGFGELAHVDDLARCTDLYYRDGRPVPLDQRLMNRAVRGEAVRGEEFILARRDGSKLHALYSGGVVRDEAGGVVLAMGLVTDITAIRTLEQAREEFISVIAHDLGTPLTAITGFAALLQRLIDARPGEEVERRAVENIRSGAWRLARMVRDLLETSRLEAKQLTLTKEPVELPKLLREVVDRAGELTQGHAVQVDVHGEVPTVEADPARVEQILDNLLSNAAKYSVPDSEILVEVEARTGEVVVRVSNRGPGIAPEEREAIFSRFHRTQAAAQGPASGLGLGLYISKGLVEAHGGRIWVDSEMGRTTTIGFTLPLG